MEDVVDDRAREHPAHTREEGSGPAHADGACEAIGSQAEQEDVSQRLQLEQVEAQRAVPNEGDQEPVERIQHSVVDHRQERDAPEDVGHPQGKSSLAELHRGELAERIDPLGEISPEERLPSQNRPEEHSCEQKEPRDRRAVPTNRARVWSGSPRDSREGSSSVGPEGLARPLLRTHP